MEPYVGIVASSAPTSALRSPTTADLTDTFLDNPNKRPLMVVENPNCDHANESITPQSGIQPTVTRSGLIDWLIDWIVFYAVSAVFQPWNGEPDQEEQLSNLLVMTTLYPGIEISTSRYQVKCVRYGLSCKLRFSFDISFCHCLVTCMFINVRAGP